MTPGGSETSGQAPAPRDAATIVLVRRGSEGLEILFVRRHSASGFMGGAVVFPGGKVDAADRLTPPPAISRRLDPTPGRTLSVEDEAALFAAACRETREEAGVSISAAELVYWAHWITPAMEPKRFDTRFFIAELAPGQTAAADLREVTESMWMTPSAALQAHVEGRIFLPPPTERTVEELSAFGTFAEIRAAAESRYIAAILPKLTVIDEQIAIVLPWDPLYDSTDGEGLAWNGPVPQGSSRIFIRPRGGAR